MRTAEESMSIDAPVERAWQALTDFESRARWSPRVKGVEIVGGNPLKVGSQIKLQVCKDRFTPVVRELKPSELLRLEVRGPGFRAWHSYCVKAVGQGSEVTLSGKYGGVLGTVFGFFAKGSIRRDLREELEAIKKEAEARPL